MKYSDDVEEYLDEWKGLALELRSNEMVDRTYLASQLELASDEVQRLLQLVNTLANIVESREDHIAGLEAKLKHTRDECGVLFENLNEYLKSFTPDT